ncbi:MAG TPA: serine hydrolase domain-containing protein [Flavitalea sp.]|nr:serine hydrolase domain-containing protein [Flavitalea sp.]
MRKLSLLFLVFNIVCTSGFTQTSTLSKKIKPALTETDPSVAGYSKERLQRIDQTIQEYVDKKWIAGATAIIVHDGKIVYYKGIGHDDIEKKTPLKRDAIFRIASQTKAITSTAVMILYEEGKFLLDDPISKYIPEFAKPKVLDKFNEGDSSYTTVPAKREITIRDLLTHTSGIDYAEIGSKNMKAIYAKAGIPSGLDAKDKTLGAEIRKLGSLPLVHQPGEKFTYGLNTDVLGYLVEVSSGMTLSEFFAKRIFEPLGMKDSYFYLPPSKFNRLATLYTEDSLKHLAKVAESVNSIRLNYPKTNGTYYSGGAGLSSTMYDYAIFMQMFLNGGEYNGKQILSGNSVRIMTMNQIGDLSDENFEFGLGFGITTAGGSAKSPLNQGAFEWGGYFGTSYWADPKENIVALIMTQQVPNSHGDLGEKFKVLVYQALN